MQCIRNGILGYGCNINILCFIKIDYLKGINVPNNVAISCIANDYCVALRNSSLNDNFSMKTTQWIFENNGSYAKVSQYSTW